jgi:hypothetical protein
VISPEEINVPFPCGLKQQPIYSVWNEEKTMELLWVFVNSLIVDYGMKPLNFKPNKKSKKYELSYHYMTIKFYVAKSEYYGESKCLRVHMEIKYDMKNTYMNEVDRLVFMQISDIYDELYQSLLCV